MSGSLDWRVNTGVFGGAFSFTTASKRDIVVDEGAGWPHLHGQRPIDEVGRLVVDVLDLDDDALIVRV